VDSSSESSQAVIQFSIFHTSTPLSYLGIYWYVLIHTEIYRDALYFCLQDTVIVVPPYPYCIKEDRNDVPQQGCWYAQPLLFFTGYLRPKDGRSSKQPTYKTGLDDLEVTLVFFSTFEEPTLPIKGPMEND
jgi:hypothetical protein